MMKGSLLKVLQVVGFRECIIYERECGRARRHTPSVAFMITDADFLFAPENPKGCRVSEQVDSRLTLSKALELPTSGAGTTIREENKEERTHV